MSQSHTDDVVVNNASAHELDFESDVPARESDVLAPVLEPPLLACIQQLNLEYLELLIAERDTPRGAAQLEHLPPRQRTALTALSPRALRMLAAMPYTVYSLGFEDEHFWNAVCAHATTGALDSVVDRHARVGDGSAQYVFCELALFHAWHVASTNMMAARVVYAMPYATAQRLSRTPLWQIRCIAASYSELMIPRWPTNPAFWPDLIRFAGMNDTRRFQTTRLLGTQLIAAELEVACELSRRDPRIALASPRLRARKLQMAPRVSANKMRSFHGED